MNLDFSKLVDLDGDELLKAMDFPFNKKNDTKKIIEWIVNSGLYYYINYKKYNLPMPNIPATNIALIKLGYTVYAKLFEATRNQLKDHKYFKSRCPETGEFYGYKFVVLDLDYRVKNEFDIGIVKLRIPEEAKRVSPYFWSGKCRCNMAFIDEIKRLKVKRNKNISDCCGAQIEPCTVTYYKTDDGDYVYERRGYSYHDSTFKYTVGDRSITVENFDEDRWHECTNGIHFFMTPEEAVNLASWCEF